MLSLQNSLFSFSTPVFLGELADKNTKKEGIKYDKDGLNTCHESANFVHEISELIELNVNEDDDLRFINVYQEAIRYFAKIIQLGFF